MQQYNYGTALPCEALEDLPAGTIVVVDVDSGVDGLRAYKTADSDGTIVGIVHYETKKGQKADVVVSGVTNVRIDLAKDTAVKPGAHIIADGGAGKLGVGKVGAAEDGPGIGRVIGTGSLYGTNDAGEYLVDVDIHITESDVKGGA